MSDKQVLKEITNNAIACGKPHEQEFSQTEVLENITLAEEGGQENKQIEGSEAKNCINYSNADTGFNMETDEMNGECNFDDSDADPTYNNRNEVTDLSESSGEENNQPVLKKSRWKKRNLSGWKSNLCKQNRAACLPYTTKSGLKKAKQPKIINCEKCRFKCSTNFDEQDRLLICKTYWGCDFNRQKDFIIKNVLSIEPKRRSKVAKAQRCNSKQYHLENSRGRFRVCANFFQATLCISNGPVNHAIKNTSEVGCFSDFDRRGHKQPGNKTSEDLIKVIKQHIESFPVMQPHYIRKSSTRKYLNSTLSINKMYELYTEFCQSNQLKSVKSHVYRRVFCTDYNYSFFRPRKDQCLQCTTYQTAKDDQKTQLQQAYDSQKQGMSTSKECRQRKSQTRTIISNCHF